MATDQENYLGGDVFEKSQVQLSKIPTPRSKLQTFELD